VSQHCFGKYLTSFLTRGDQRPVFGPSCLERYFIVVRLIKATRAVQPVAICRQSPYLHKPPVVIVTPFSLWRLAPTALAAPVLTMTSLSLWRHSLLSWPRPPLRTYTYVTDTLPRLIYKDAIHWRHQGRALQGQWHVLKDNDKYIRSRTTKTETTVFTLAPYNAVFQVNLPVKQTNVVLHHWNALARGRTGHFSTKNLPNDRWIVQVDTRLGQTAMHSTTRLVRNKQHNFHKQTSYYADCVSLRHSTHYTTLYKCF